MPEKDIKGFIEGYLNQDARYSPRMAAARFGLSDKEFLKTVAQLEAQCAKKKKSSK